MTNVTILYKALLNHQAAVYLNSPLSTSAISLMTPHKEKQKPYCPFPNPLKKDHEEIKISG